MYIVQERRASGYTSLRRYQSEGRALDTCRAFGETSPGGTFRVITGDPFGAFQVIAVRCPAS